jgi:hypothetical protein
VTLKYNRMNPQNEVKFKISSSLDEIVLFVISQWSAAVRTKMVSVKIRREK